MHEAKKKSTLLMYLRILMLMIPSVATAGGLLHLNDPIYSRLQNSTIISYPPHDQYISMQEKVIQTLGLAKTRNADESQWKCVSEYIFVYSTTANKWGFSSRDTIIYDSEGRVILRKSTTAETGWTLENLFHIDSTIWEGSRKIENFYLSLQGGMIRDSMSSKTTWQYSNDYKTCVFTYYERIFDKWRMYILDTTIYSMPITAPYSPDDYGPTNFVSNHSYLRNSSGTMAINQLYTKIEAESNDSMCVLLSQAETILDSAKIYKKYLSNGIRCDSTIVKDTNGNWVDKRLTTYVNDTTGTLISSNKNYQNGSWGAGYILIDAKHEIRFWNNWDSKIKQWRSVVYAFYDNDGNITLDGNIWWNTTTNSWDTLKQERHIYTYDPYGNLASSVYQTKDSTKPWGNIDSTVYTYAQINSASAQIASQKASNPISISQTSRMLNVLTPGITGIRIYDIAGRLAVIVKQPAAPTFSLDLSKAGSSRMTAGRYLVQVETNKGRHTIPLLIMR
jgi:hypothetical protein